jgi:integrase/recombinase XerD
VFRSEEAIMTGSKPARVRVTGPLEASAEGFFAELTGRGYTLWSATGQLRLLAHLSRWLVSEGLALVDLTDANVERFLQARRDAGYAQLCSPRGLAPLLAYLRDRGVVPQWTPATSDGVIDGVLADFGGYLVRERGVGAGTVGCYQHVARSFLSGRGRPDGAAVEGLTAKDVSEFVLAESRTGAGSLRHTASALRSLLRFLHLQGHTAWPLVASVPTAAGWHHAPLPRALEPDRVARLVNSCDRRTAIGRRDYAILILLARLGLRASEVSTLTLDDVDWRAGEIVVRGKADHWERLPLPADVGQALAEYLHRGRRRTGGRHMFARSRAPYGGLTNHGVCSVVRAACDRAGLPRVGAHRLRHAAATEIRRAGAPLSEVAQLLRHRRLATTAIYTTVDRVDREALRSIARPWPAGAR